MSEMRLQRALAQAGIASRRAAEELITAGKVRVNGTVATLGSKVDPATQTITVSGRAIPKPRRRWLAFHKPLGVVTTASDEEGRRTVFDLIDDPKGLTYVGRLDVMTTGLLLLTSDGEAVHRLTHPRFRIERSYTALVHGRPTAEIAAAVKLPVAIDGKPVVPIRPRVRPGDRGRSILDVTLTEGRNRIVRRWCEAMGLKVERLARLSYGPVRLGDLPVGRSRPLTPKEEAAIYAAVKLTPEQEPVVPSKPRSRAGARSRP
ncbi:MAG: pseudouridine synthase [Gemmatimonadales bacterium]